MENFDVSVFAITLKPFGNFITSSAWLIHTSLDLFPLKKL